MRKRYQDYYEVEVARECGLNAAAVATFLWRRLIHDPNMKYRHGYAWIKASYGLMSFAMPFLTKAQARYAVGKLVDINMLDHIIVAGESGKLTSFRAEGLLEDMERKSFDLTR